MLKNSPNPLITTPNYITLDEPMPSRCIFGIDRTKLSYPLDMDLTLPLDSGWTPKLGKNGEDYFTKEVIVSGSRVRLTCLPALGRGSIDFNPASMMYGKTKELLHPDDLTPVTERLLLHLCPEFMPKFLSIDSDGCMTLGRGFESWVSISKIELATQFEIPKHMERQVQQSITATSHRSGRTTMNVRQKDGWSEYKSTKTQGSVKLYNKSAELKSKYGIAPRDDGMVDYRFEAVIQGNRKGRFGLTTLADVSSELVWNALAVLFHQHNWAVRASGRGDVLSKLGKLTYREREQLLGYNAAVVSGLDHDISDSARRSKKRLATSVGLDASIDWSTLPNSSWRLSLSHGGLDFMNS